MAKLQQQTIVKQNVCILPEVNYYDIILERELEIRKIERDVLEIHDIYVEIAKLIEQQGEMISLFYFFILRIIMMN